MGGKLIEDELRELLARSDIQASWVDYVSPAEYYGSDETSHARDAATSRLTYNSYIKNSSCWKQKRKERLEHDKHICVICHSEAKDVHHIRYPNVPEQFGEETMADLVSLCRRCHEFITLWEGWYKSEKQKFVIRMSISRNWDTAILTNHERMTIYCIVRNHLQELFRK